MFYFDDFFGKKVLKSSLLNDCEHFFTTRDFILHPGTRSDLQQIAVDNIRFLSDKLGISENSLFRLNQVHSANVALADSDIRLYDNTDGIVLTKAGQAAFLNFADCIPIILYDSKNNIGSIVHAGWRGTASKIVKNALEIMFSFGSKSSDIKIAIGPGIGKCCFDVNEDVLLQITDGIPDNIIFKYNAVSELNSEGKAFVDLKLINKIICEELCVSDIDVSDYCTFHNSDLFFSYRKEHKNTARHSAVLKLKELI